LFVLSCFVFIFCTFNIGIWIVPLHQKCFIGYVLSL